MRIIGTTQIVELSKRNRKLTLEVNSGIRKFTKHYWGEVPDDVAQKNQEALERGRGLILGVYRTSKGGIHIFTEGKHDKLIICFAGEYVRGF